MTSNQIAAASVRESERHNTVTETETTRHNQATEALQEDLNQITRDYNQQRLFYEDKWNRLQLEFTSANEERKRMIESESNEIKWQLARIDEEYKAQMARIESERTDIDKTYKNAMANVATFNAELQAKRDYYTNQKTEADINYINAQVGLQRRRLRMEETRIQQEYELGLISADQKADQLKLAQDQFDFEVAKYNDVIKANVEADTKLKHSGALKNAAEVVLKSGETAVNVITKIFGYR